MNTIGTIGSALKAPPETASHTAKSVSVVPVEKGVKTEAIAAPVEERASGSPPAADDVKEAVNRLEEAFKSLDLNIRLKHEINDKTKDVVVKVFSEDSGELIRQIPSEEVVALRERLADLIGVLFRGRA